LSEPRCTPPTAGSGAETGRAAAGIVMVAPILIVGQGIAGTALAWEFERAGFSFEIADAGLDGSATQVAAGIVNPITGQRFVKNWRIDSLLGPSREFYQGIGRELGIELVRDVRIRRLFADVGEFARGKEKADAGKWRPYVDASAVEPEGFWIEGGCQVDLPALLEGSRRRWIKRGMLQQRVVDPPAEISRRDLVILCTGGGLYREFGDSLKFERAKGEVIEVAAAGGVFEPGVIRSGDAWVVPRSHSTAQVGSTYDREAEDLVPTGPARETLFAHLRGLHPGIEARIERQRCGWRMSVPDRRPVVGRVPGLERMGIFGGLSSKGVLTAPWIARQWVHHLAEGIGFDADIAIGRCWQGCVRMGLNAETPRRDVRRE